MPSNIEDQWDDVVSLLSQDFDGLLIAGYPKGGGERFIRGFAKDDACADGLRPVRDILQHWIKPDEGEEEE